MTKEEAIEIFLWLCQAIYTQHRQLRTYFQGDKEVMAFHLIAKRLEEIGNDFSESERYLGLSFHPFYPVVKDKDSGKYYISHYWFHKWIDSYLNVLRRIEPLRKVVELHDNERDYTRAIQESWGKFKEPITEEENAQYAEFVQKQWEALQAKQLSLFPESD